MNTVNNIYLEILGGIAISLIAKVKWTICKSNLVEKLFLFVFLPYQYLNIIILQAYENGSEIVTANLIY